MKKPFFKISILLVTAMVMLAGCGGKEEKSKQINIGYFNNVTHAQALYMKAEKSLENAFGTEKEVTWTAFNAGPAEVEALFAEDIDIGYIGPVPAINANVKSDGDVVILSGASKGGAVFITRKDAKISSVADLAGKNVAIPQIGNTQHLCLLNLLNENGLKPVTEGGDVTISAISNADVANTMERGDIDAALVPEPWGATLLGNGAELLLDYDAVMGGDYDVALIVVRKEFLEENPDVVEKFLEQHAMATEAIQTNSDTALAIINQELEKATGKKLEESIIQEAFTRIGVSTELNKNAIAEFAQIGVEQKFISDLPKEGSLYAE
ncbi:MAG: aliphatic sulfonate ABC transporter substrate-binding protein [Lachnospiraceae bacterium]|nr:aliphatic sulfonate ABC transporter substrate-binding protein [Lachnospiraceae bacterium]